MIIPHESWPALNCLTAPETIHWAVTYQCRSCCLDCYVRRHGRRDDGEMNTAEALTAVAALAVWGVFQLALGGGEPFIRPDLVELASTASQLGMVVHVTTGLAELPEKTLGELSPAVKVLQMNIDEHRLTAEPDKEMKRPKRRLQIAAAAGMISGANLRVSKTMLANFKTIMNRLAECGFCRITLLRYKPSPSYDRWTKENPSPQSLLTFELLLKEAVVKWPHLSIR